VIQCRQCEFFAGGPEGELAFRCDPFGSIKEPECLVKWQLLRTVEMAQKIERMVGAYEATLAVYKRLEPLQEKMFRRMEKEIDELEEGEGWKREEDEEEGRGQTDDDDGDSPWSQPRQ
jgi:hypothetical protein